MNIHKYKIQTNRRQPSGLMQDSFISEIQNTNILVLWIYTNTKIWINACLEIQRHPFSHVQELLMGLKMGVSLTSHSRRKWWLCRRAGNKTHLSVFVSVCQILAPMTVVSLARITKIRSNVVFQILKIQTYCYKVYLFVWLARFMGIHWVKWAIYDPHSIFCGFLTIGTTHFEVYLWCQYFPMISNRIN